MPTPLELQKYEVELSQRVLNFDESGLWTRQCALR